MRDVERRTQIANQRNVDEFAAGVDVPAGVREWMLAHVAAMWENPAAVAEDLKLLLKS